MSKNRSLMTLLLFFFIITPLAAENDTVHTFSFTLHSLADVDNIEDTSYEAEFIWEPEIYGYGERSETVFRPCLVFPIDGGEDFHRIIQELRFSFFPTENLIFEAGMYIHDSSFAAFFSKTAFFRAVDYQELLKGNPDSVALSSWLAEGTCYFGDWYIRGSLEPFRKDIPFFEVDSVWFPNLGFPEVVYSPFFGPDGKIELKELRLVEPETRTTWNRLIEDIGGSLEIGGRIGPMDFLLNAASGRDTTPLYSAEMILSGNEDYSIDLHPIENRQNSIGLALRTIFEPLVVYGETAFSLDKTFIKETFYSTDSGFETENYRSPYIGITTGGRWEWWETNLLISMEYTNGFILDKSPRTVMPFFQQMVLGSVQWAPFDGRLSCTAAGVVALEDGSVAGNLGFTWAPGEGRLSLELSMPLFFGSPDSCFGQYREILYPTLSSSIRY